jgi:hypothetical protein
MSSVLGSTSVLTLRPLTVSVTMRRLLGCPPLSALPFLATAHRTTGCSLKPSSQRHQSFLLPSSAMVMAQWSGPQPQKAPLPVLSRSL